jgi:hypothetical protein
MAIAGVAFVAGCEQRDKQAESVAPATAESAGAAAQAEAQDRPDDRYSTVVKPKEVPVGETTPVTLSIEAGSGLHPNREYPGWSFTWKETPDWKVAPTKVAQGDITLGDRRAYFRADVTPKKPGAVELKATGDFSVCNDQTCHILRGEEVAFQIKAKQKGSEK